MKLSRPPAQILRVLLFFPLVSFGVFPPARAQENEGNVQQVQPRQVPARPTPAAAVKPVARIPLPRVQPRAQQRPTPPPRRVQPAAKPAGGSSGAGEGAQAVGQINRGRGVNPRLAGAINPRETGASGVASRPALRIPPNARSAAMPGGGTAVVHPDGRRWVVDNSNHVRGFARPGLQAKYDDQGRLNLVHVASANNPNLTIARSVRGAREAIGMRPGGVFVVTEGRDRGFVQRPIPGRPGFFQRNSLVDGRPVARVYRFYRFGGVVYLRYVPATRYDAYFYQWAGNPWRSQVAYAWGWGEAPWLIFQAGYFTPSPVYPSAALWLTDYVLAENLKTAYQNHEEYEQNEPNPAPATESTAPAASLTPEAKDAIAQEVQAQVTEEGEVSTPAGRALPARRQALLRPAARCAHAGSRGGWQSNPSPVPMHRDTLSPRERVGNTFLLPWGEGGRGTRSDEGSRNP